MADPIAPRGLQTTTADAPSTDRFLLRVSRGEQGWIVGDLVTARFGAGATLPAALADYAEDLHCLTELDGPCGPPLKAEVDWAREVFRDG
jgi:hypothetical protein